MEVKAEGDALVRLGLFITVNELRRGRSLRTTAGFVSCDRCFPHIFCSWPVRFQPFRSAFRLLLSFDSFAFRLLLTCEGCGAGPGSVSPPARLLSRSFDSISTPVLFRCEL